MKKHLFLLVLSTLVVFGFRNEMVNAAEQDFSTESEEFSNENLIIGIEPMIEADGSFSFETGTNLGDSLISTTFNISSSSIGVNIIAHGEADSFIVYLERKDYLIWVVEKSVTYYTDGQIWGYTFNNLDISKKYRLRFVSLNGRVWGNGNISNYVSQ